MYIFFNYLKTERKQSRNRIFVVFQKWFKIYKTIFIGVFQGHLSILNAIEDRSKNERLNQSKGQKLLSYKTERILPNK